MQVYRTPKVNASKSMQNEHDDNPRPQSMNVFWSEVIGLCKKNTFFKHADNFKHEVIKLCVTCYIIIHTPIKNIDSSTVVMHYCWVHMVF